MEKEATYVKDIDSCGNVPGAWSFYQARGNVMAGITYICPCGCKMRGSVPLDDGSGELRRKWKLSGTIEKPSLNGSVKLTKFTGEKEIEHWQGWLKNGQWISV